MQNKKTTENEPEVLIVGAGPAGLMMACQLAIQGVRFRIIDKKENPTTHSGALIIQAGSIEIFDQMGIAHKFIREGIIAQHINILCNGKPLHHISLKNMGSGLSAFPYLLMVKQSRTEEILTEFIKEKGYAIERGIELLNVYQDSAGVITELRTSDGCIESFKTPYLIGADGGKSLIRQQLKIPFPGKAHDQSLYITDCKTDLKTAQDDIFISITTHSISGFFPLSDGKWRIDGIIPTALKKKERLTFEDIEHHFSKRTKIETQISDPQWFSVFYSRQHCAASFQKDRCFLIGDAAHIHSPVGAQGMNTGLQDAYNLSWKLAFALRKMTGPTLLASYTHERQPIAINTARSTGHIFKLLTAESIMHRTFRSYLFPFIINWVFPVVERSNRIGHFLFKSVSQTGVHYRESTLSLNQSIGMLPSQKLRPGDRLPSFTFEEKGCEVNIRERIKPTAFHLFIFTEYHLPNKINNQLERYRNILTFETLFKSDGTKNLFLSLNIKKNGLLLIRPDLYIAFYSKTLNFNALEKYLNYILFDGRSKDRF